MRRIKKHVLDAGAESLHGARSNSQHARRRPNAMVYFDHSPKKDAETDII
jgi:hypothetical protein